MVSQINERGLKAKLGRTRARLQRLAVFRAFFLPATLLIAIVALVAVGAFSALGDGLRALLIFIVTPLIVLTFVRAFLNYRAPSSTDVRDRLDATDPERPLAALSDFPASFNKDTKAYWARHREHLQIRIARLSAPDLSSDWQREDPFFLRFLAPLALVALIGLNYSAIPSRLSDIGRSDIGALFGAQDLRVSAWLTPPEHTGEAPVFLTSDKSDVSVPAGSVLTFRVHGAGAPTLRRRAMAEEALHGPRNLKLKKYIDGAYQAEFAVNAPQEISLHYWGERASWQLQTNPDLPPGILFVGDPERGEDDKLSFRWEAEDDYGLTAIHLVLTTTEDSGIGAGQTDRVRIDLPGAFSQLASDTARLDLVRHKWSGLTVDLLLEATDTSGQTGRSEAVTYTLPEKLFLEPMAKSSQEIRLTLLREDERYQPIEESVSPDGVMEGLGDRLEAAPDDVQRAALMLEAVTYRPDIFSDDMTVYLGLKRAFEGIRAARNMQALEPLEPLLWAVAMRSEYGTLADAARRLEAARRALERALREGASEEEIRQLMQAFREAAEDYIAARMAEAMMNPDGGGAGQSGGQNVEGQDLEDMLAALEDLTETGATDAARQLLDDVSNLLNNLQFQMGQNGGDSVGQDGEPGEGGDEGTPEEQALQGALDKLSELMEEQRRLNDDTLQENYGSGEQPQDLPGQSGGGEMSDGMLGEDGEPAGPGQQQEEGQSLAERQRGILNDLQAFSEELGEDTGEGSGLTAEEFNEARRALERATRALNQEDFDAAQWNQDRAIQELRDAAGALAGELDEQRQARQADQGEDTINESDPLGRPAGGARQDESDNVTVPDEVERQRARDILDDLRERLNNSEDPEEREYLERLLDRFGGS